MTKEIKRQLKKKLFHYVIPSVVSMWVFTIYTMVDGMFVARGVGPTALAAVNISMPFINGAFALGILLAIGASTLASFSKGQGDSQRANEIFTFSTVTVFIIGLVLALIATFNIERLANILGATDATRQYVIEYLGTIVIFVVFYVTSYNLEVLIKADGFPHKAIITVSSGAICNIALDYVFVFIFHWGIKGAAFATGISQMLTFTIFLIHFLSKKSNFSFVKVKVEPILIARMAKIGAADSITELSVGIVIFMFNNTIVRVIGDSGVIIYTVIAYVSQLVLMTMMGINQGMQPLVSYYNGKEEEVVHKYILRLAIGTAMCASLVAFGGAMLYPESVVTAFIDKSTDAALFSSATDAMKLFSFSFLPLGAVVILGGYCTALERSKMALTISTCRGLIFVAISLVLMVIIFGEIGIWLAMAVSEACALGLALLMYKKL